MQIPATSYWEVEACAPLIARSDPIGATMFLQEEGEETKAPRAKPNDVERVVETSAETPDELGI
jgi:hypothetical protein